VAAQDVSTAQEVSAVSPRGLSPLARSITTDPPSAPIPSYDLDLLPIVDRSHYEFLGDVGRGGLGRVLKAFERRLNRVVAVKEMLGGGGASSSRRTFSSARSGRP
jgi:hypothetical protein